jgi:hypothetical protein
VARERGKRVSAWWTTSEHDELVPVLEDAGINLFGASVAPGAHGQGVYRSFVLARWELAVERGTPALTVQAGRMSRPICERMGFGSVGAVRVFDELAG